MFCSDLMPSTVGAIAGAIAKGHTDEEIALLAAAFTQLGDSLTLILAARSCLDFNKCPRSKNT